MRTVVLVILLFSSLAVLADEAVFVDRDSLIRREASVRKTDSRVLAAGYLERAGRLGEAAEQLLVDEQSGRIDSVQAVEILANLEDYQQLDAYKRARFISDARWRDWGVDRYNAFWLGHAAVMLQHEQLWATEKALRHLHKPWNAAHAIRRYSLWGRLYLQQGNYADAVIALDKQPTVADDGLFDHYNFGIALIQAGQRDRGLALIDEIGYLPMESEEHRVLRDRVNLSMGWYWLAADQGGTAREYFRRVRLEGPYSNMALLGLGWAELADDGEPQRARFKRRVLCEKPEVPPDALMRLLSDRYAACRPGEKSGVFDVTHDFAFDAAEHGPERYREALRPWQVLVQRGVHDPAVQEALLAAAYAQQQRQAKAEAEQAYRLAIRRYEAETIRLSELESALKAAEMDPDAVVARRALPGEFALLQGRHDYVQVHEARQALREVERSLQAMTVKLERLDGKTSSVERSTLQARMRRLQDEVSGTGNALDKVLRHSLLEDLALRRARLDQYHARARLALAQFYDQDR